MLLEIFGIFGFADLINDIYWAHSVFLHLVQG